MRVFFRDLIEIAREGGKTYYILLRNDCASGNCSLYVEKVNMHTVYIDQNIENGTVEGDGSVSYMVYADGARAPKMYVPKRPKRHPV